jgi:hypothetical protein
LNERWEDLQTSRTASKIAAQAYLQILKRSEDEERGSCFDLYMGIEPSRVLRIESHISSKCDRLVIPDTAFTE